MNEHDILKKLVIELSGLIWYVDKIYKPIFIKRKTNKHTYGTNLDNEKYVSRIEYIDREKNTFMICFLPKNLIKIY